MVRTAPAKRKIVQRRTRSTLTVAGVVQALKLSAGLQAAAAKRLRVDRATVCRFIQTHPEINAAIEEIEDELLDVSESKLIAGIQRGEFNFVRFHLEHKGRKRGYGKQVAITGKDGGPIEVSTSGGVSGLLAAAKAIRDAGTGSA